MADSAKAPDWLIWDVLEANTVGVMFAPSQSFKSFIVMSMAHAVASGDKWCGHDTEQGAVVYCCAEGGAGARRRSLALRLDKGYASGDSGQFEFDLEPIMLDSQADVSDFIAFYASRPDKNPPRLVIIDTLSMSMSGDENSKQGMGAAMAGAQRIRDALGCCVLIIHHTGHGNSERTRGSSSLPCDADCLYSVKRPDMGDTCVITNTKMKDGEVGGKHCMRFRTVKTGIVDKKGRSVTSGVVDYVPMTLAEIEEAEIKKQEQKLPAKQKEILKAALRHGDRLSKDDWVIQYKAAGINPTNATKFKNRMIDAGLIFVDGDGSIALTAKGKSAAGTNTWEPAP